ncbi:MAG: hypothetical protein ACR2FN_05295 [Chitinophagaceae bacterium]
MKFKLLFFLLFIAGNILAQQTKSKNIIVISMDGYRWKELFQGADSSLLFNKNYISQDSLWLMQKYWATDATERREKLMPFIWQQIAKHGQIYGNRNFGNNVNVKNKYWFSYPAAAKHFVVIMIQQLTQTIILITQMKMFWNLSISKMFIKEK